MDKKLLELLDSINEKKALVKNLADAGKIEEAKAAKTELVQLQDKFDVLKDIEDSVPAPDTMKKEPMTNKKDSAEAKFANDARRGFKDYSGFSEGDDENGGYTVPEEIDTRIRKYRDAQFNLGQLVTVIPTRYKSGEWTFRKKGQLKGLVKVPENGKIPAIAMKGFERMTYSVDKYAGVIPATAEVLDDSDANLTAYIVENFGEITRNTRNEIVLDALASGKKDSLTDSVKYEVVDEAKGVDGITKLINITLGAAYNATSKIITNDYGIQTLCEMKDANGRSLLQPDPTEPTKKVLASGSLLLPIVQVPKEIMPNVTDNGKQYAPIIIGDLKEAIVIFERKKSNIKASDTATVGDMNAYEQDLTFFRIIEREGAKVKDPDAYVYAHFKTEIK